MNITQEEVKKLANLSRIAVTDQEAARLQNHLNSVLSYAARVQEIAQDCPEPAYTHDPRLRTDTASSYQAQKIIQQAPESQENLFVVPKIL